MTALHPAPSIPATVKALIFDVFGTLVDWRTSVAREAQAALAPLGLHTDWLAFAEAWRGEYQGAMEAVRSGQIAFCKLDVLHRRNLDIVLARLGWQAVDEGTRAHLNHAWHRLDAWPDVEPGLAHLRERFRLAPCSNGNISLMVDLARHNGWHWDAILGAEVAGDYKPKPVVYQRACEALGLEPPQVMMVAAHSDDLAAAAACGLHTGFVARPLEYGGLMVEDRPRVPVTVDFGDRLPA
jgi:2-haloacid dehalogenase